MASLSPETLFEFSGITVTNSLVTTILVDIVLISLIFILHKNFKSIPGKFQSVAETVVSYFYGLTSELAHRSAKSIYPWVTTFFLVIFVTNIVGLLPGVASIGFFTSEKSSTEETVGSTPSKDSDKSAAQHPEKKEAEHEEGFIPLLRPSTSDFNATFALAFVSLIATHALSIKYTGLKGYITRFVSLNPILLFVGVLELISEFIKMFSLSFRLFGNIYAGEVVLHTISSLFAFLAPIPFLLLESIVAVVQALVFSMLTLVFMSIMTAKHSEEH